MKSTNPSARHASLGALALTIFLLVSPASAQTLLTSGDASGGLTLNPSQTALALNFGTSGTSYTVQGVTFTEATSSSTTVNGVTFAETGFDTPLAAAVTPSFGPGADANSVALANIASNLIYDGNGDEITFTLSGLQGGDTYTIDFLTDLDGYSPARDLIFTAGSATSPTYLYPETGIYDTQLEVTADQSSGEISGSISSINQGPYLSGLVVTEVETPEPSTWAMVLGGMGALLFINRFRRVS